MRWHSIKFIFLLLATVLTCATGISQSVERQVKVFDKFHQFSPLLEHQNDTTYVINFWATWCKPCVAELPYFEQINEKFRGEKLKVILVSLDAKRLLDKKVKPFLKKNEIKSKVVLLDDTKYNDWIDKVDQSWSGAIPATVFYNSKEKIFLEQEFESRQEIETIIHKLLKS